MYHSDYDSDWESPIKSKWRPYHSDTEDLEQARFRSVKPKLKTPSKNVTKHLPEREIHGPHHWESHEDIEKLEREIRKNRMDFEKEKPAIIDSLKRTKTHQKVQNVFSVNSHRQVSKKVMPDFIVPPPPPVPPTTPVTPISSISSVMQERPVLTQTMTSTKGPSINYVISF